MVDLSFYKGKKVFVTGHTGFKGSWLCEILLLAGAEVIGYALPPETEPNLFEKLGLSSKVTHIEGDIRDLDKLCVALQESRAELVFHLAAQPIVRTGYKDPIGTYSTNVMGTVNILEAVRRAPTVKAVLNVTTDKVYENKERAEGYREEEILCGFDPYSNSKSCSELVTYSYKHSFFADDDSPAISTARSGNVIGGGDFSVDRIIPDCVRAAIENRTIEVRNPYSTRPYQHVLDCLGGYLLLMQQQYSNKEFATSFNFGPNDADCLSTGDLVDLFCNEWCGTTWENRSDGGPHEAGFLKLCCDKAKSILGWQPVWGIKTAVAKTVAWYKTYAGGGNLLAVTDDEIKEFFKL